VKSALASASGHQGFHLERFASFETFIQKHNERAKPFHWSKREVKGSQLRNTIVNLCN
jgi:hypothetical protein